MTETDRAVEALVSSRLAAAYPSFAFVGEETYKPGVRVTEAPTFVVDPIDGTTNFVHGFPSACVSLGLAVARRPVVGVVYNPFQDTRESPGPDAFSLSLSLFFFSFFSFLSFPSSSFPSFPRSNATLPCTPPGVNYCPFIILPPS